MLLTIFLIGLAIVAVGLGALIFFDKKSYKHEALIIKPIGENNYARETDNFKLKKKKTGVYEVWFEKHKGKAYNPPVNMWSYVWKSDKPMPDADAILEANGEELRKSLVKGAMFVQVSPREYKLAKITNLGDIEVIDQDTIELVLDDIERERQLTTSFRDKLLQAGVWIGSLIIIGILFVVIFTLSTQYAGEQGANIINAASQAAQGAVGA